MDVRAAGGSWRERVYWAPVKVHVPVSLRALACAALVGALSAGCSETTPVQDVVSRTFTLEDGAFVTKFDLGSNSGAGTARFTMREITAEIVAAGSVTAEVDLGSKGKEWSALPLAWRFTDRDGNLHVVDIQPSYNEGEFMLSLRGDIDGTHAGVLALDGFLLRVVAIHAAAADA